MYPPFSLAIAFTYSEEITLHPRLSKQTIQMFGLSGLTSPNGLGEAVPDHPLIIFLEDCLSGRQVGALLM